MSHKMLILNLLGTPEVKLHGNPLPNWVTKKAQALLFYLAVTGQAHTRDEIATLFWPEMADRQARKNLRTVLPELTKSIGDYIKPGNQTIVFNRQLPYQLDVEALRNLFASDPSRSDSNTLRQTMLLYRGEFLKGFYVRNDYTFEEWVRSQREYLQALAVRGFTLLTERYFEQREYALGLEITHRLLLIEPWLESAHRQQMRLLALNGQRSAALTQYRICQEILATEFDATPAAETLALYEQIRTGKWPGVNPLSSTAATVQTNRPAESRPVALPESSEPAKTMQAPLTENLPSSDASNQAHPLPFVQAGNVPVIELFLGRQAELTQLNHWLLKDRCRLAAILGLGGQGKTTLAASLVQHLFDPDQVGADGFQQVLWRSLLNAPPLTEVLQSWLQSLAPQWLDKLPERLDDQLDLLLNCLQQQRCLLVLDNLESILQAGERAGYYRAGYADYGQLIDQVATRRHQSCLLLTSREEPHQLKQLAVGVTRCRTLRLPGLNLEAGQSLLAAARLTNTAEDAQRLVAHYSGNPLALKLIIATIQELFGGNIQMFLATASVIFDDIRDVLDQQFGRLSHMEQQLMYWLAIEREPVSLDLLHKNFVVAQPYWVLLEALRSLQRRSLVELSGELVGLQNVITEYVTARLVAATIQDLTIYNREMRPANWSIKEDEARKGMSHPRLEQTYFNLYALVNAQAKEYVRSTQVRLLLEPVANALRQAWGLETIATRMQVLLHRLRLEAPLAPGHAAANILHLLLHLQIDLRGYDFSCLSLRQVDLRAAHLPQVNLTQANLADALFLEPTELTLSLTFTADGALLVAGTYKGDIYLWRLADRQPLTVLKGHTSLLYSVALSPDGALLASGGLDEIVRLWDMASAELRHTLRRHLGAVRFVWFSSGGEWLFSYGEDRSVQIWQLLPHNGVLQPPQLQGVIPNLDRPLTVHPSGKLILSAQGKRVAGWHVATQQLSYTLAGHTDEIVAMTLSPDGKLLATGSVDQTIRIWDVLSLEELPRLRHVLATPINYRQLLAFSLDNQTLASTRDGQILLWDLSSGALRLRLSGSSATIRAVAFHPNSHTVVSASQDQSIRLWDISKGQVESTLQGHSSWIDVVNFSPASLTLVSCHLDATVILWELPTGRPHPLGIHDYKGTFPGALYSPDGKILATIGHDTPIYLWDVATRAPLGIIPGPTDNENAVVFHPTAPLLAMGSADYTLQLWNIDKGELLTAQPGHTSRFSFLVFGPDGTTLASASKDQTVGLWAISPDGRVQLRTLLHGHNSPVVCLVFHPSGRWLASCGAGVLLWDVAHATLCETVQESSQEVYHIAFSPNGAWLISVSLDGTIHIWAVNAGDTSPGPHCQLRHVLHEAPLKAAHIGLSPDSTTLAVRGADRTVRLFDLATGQLRQQLTGHERAVTSVSYSPDGRQLSSSSSDGTIRIWDPQSGVCIQVLRIEAPYAGMNITGVTGVTPAQKAALKALGAVEEED